MTSFSPQPPGTNLLQAWEQTVKRFQDRTALSSSSGAPLRSFEEIDREAITIRENLPAGLDLGMVAFCGDNEPEWIACFLALLRAGASILLLEMQTASLPTFPHLLQQCGVTAVAQLSGGQLAVQATNLPAPGWSSRPAILKLTSGTGGEARMIPFTAASILADCHSVCDTMGISAEDLNYGVISMSHSYGFSNLVTPLICRGVPMVVSNDRMPRSILHGIVSSGATVFPGTPVFFQKLNGILAPEPLGRLRLAISAGAPLTVEVAEQFFLATGQKIHAFYGSSECGGICYDASSEPILSSGYVGTPMRGVELELDESSGLPTIKSPAVGEGYYPNPAPETLSAGIFRPADLLAREGSGFRIVGRISDLINVAGRKLNPVDVEKVLLGCPGVEQAVVFGIANAARGQTPAACVVATGLSEQQLLSACRSQLPAWQAPKFVRFVDAIPLTARGKVSRADLSQRFAEG